ncbi:MAG: flagellar biosynthesis anti-sigma factor FlgM [Bacillota bacterium]
MDFKNCRRCGRMFFTYGNLCGACRIRINEEFAKTADTPVKSSRVKFFAEGAGGAGKNMSRRRLRSGGKYVTYPPTHLRKINSKGKKRYRQKERYRRMIISNSQVQTVLKIYANQIEELRKNTQGKSLKKEDIMVAQEKKEQKAMESKIKHSLASTPEVRTDKVADLKKRIAEGKYDVTSRMIAEKMLNRSLIDGTLKD